MEKCSHYLTSGPYCVSIGHGSSQHSLEDSLNSSKAFYLECDTNGIDICHNRASLSGKTRPLGASGLLCNRVPVNGQGPRPDHVLSRPQEPHKKNRIRPSYFIDGADTLLLHFMPVGLAAVGGEKFGGLQLGHLARLFSGPVYSDTIIHPMKRSNVCTRAKMNSRDVR